MVLGGAGTVRPRPSTRPMGGWSARQPALLRIARALSELWHYVQVSGCACADVACTRRGAQPSSINTAPLCVPEGSTTPRPVLGPPSTLHAQLGLCTWRFLWEALVSLQRGDGGAAYSSQMSGRSRRRCGLSGCLALRWLSTQMGQQVPGCFLVSPQLSEGHFFFVQFIRPSRQWQVTQGRRPMVAIRGFH